MHHLAKTFWWACSEGSGWWAPTIVNDSTWIIFLYSVDCRSRDGQLRLCSCRESVRISCEEAERSSIVVFGAAGFLLPLLSPTISIELKFCIRRSMELSAGRFVGILSANSLVPIQLFHLVIVRNALRLLFESES